MPEISFHIKRPLSTRLKELWGTIKTLRVGRVGHNYHVGAWFGGPWLFGGDPVVGFFKDKCFYGVYSRWSLNLCEAALDTPSTDPSNTDPTEEEIALLVHCSPLDIHGRNRLARLDEQLSLMALDKGLQGALNARKTPKVTNDQETQG